MNTKKLTCLILIVEAVFSSCNQKQNSNQQVQVGEFDSSAIAQDTLMQKGIESSYEYSKSLVVNDTLVYDIRAYGGSASSGEFAILRRGADNHSDTMIKDKRYGIIANSILGDINNNGEEEVYIVIRDAGNRSYENLVNYEFDKTGKPHQYWFPDPSKGEHQVGYKGQDSIFLKNHFVVRQFPVYKTADENCCPTGGMIRVIYARKERPNQRVSGVWQELKRESTK